MPVPPRDVLRAVAVGVGGEPACRAMGEDICPEVLGFLFVCLWSGLPSIDAFRLFCGGGGAASSSLGVELEIGFSPFASDLSSIAVNRDETCQPKRSFSLHLPGQRPVSIWTRDTTGRASLPSSTTHSSPKHHASSMPCERST